MAKITDKLWKKPGNGSQPYLTIQIPPTSSYGVPRLRQTIKGHHLGPTILTIIIAKFEPTGFESLRTATGQEGKTKD